MHPDNIDRQEAATLFLDSLIIRAYDGAIRSVTSLLENGLSSGRQPEEQRSLHQWFQELDEEAQRNIRAIIQRAVYSSVFGACAVLDGISGGYAIPGTVSNFALYLESHRDPTADITEPPDDTIKICPNVSGIDLHDLIVQMLQVD